MTGTSGRWIVEAPSGRPDVASDLPMSPAHRSSFSMVSLRQKIEPYLWLAPSILLLAVFLYFPAVDGMKAAFYEWNGGAIRRFVGWDNFLRAARDVTLWKSFLLVGILVAANVVRMIPSILTAVAIHRLKSAGASYLYRIAFVIPMIIPEMVWLLIWKYFFDPNLGVLNAVLRATGGLSLLAAMDRSLGWGGLFVEGSDPAWLSHSALIVPSLIIWGFPWIGVVGVLIYLAGLNNIDSSLYEAARVDGAGPVAQFFKIEIPLIATQIRLNFILMIVGTLQAYGLVLVLLGDAGGPGGAGMMPGLYMFRKAFVDREAGYACAIGIILFIFILGVTSLSNRWKVEK